MPMGKFRGMWLIGITLLCLLVIIAGCGGQQGPENATETPDTFKITIAYLVGDQLHQYALPIAQEKGYFAEEGEVELKEFRQRWLLALS